MFLILTHHFKFSSQKHDTVISIFLRSPKKKIKKCYIILMAGNFILHSHLLYIFSLMHHESPGYQMFGHLRARFEASIARLSCLSGEYGPFLCI